MHFQLVSRKYSNHLENKKRFTRFCFLYDSRNFLKTAEKTPGFSNNNNNNNNNKKIYFFFIYSSRNLICPVSMMTPQRAVRYENDFKYDYSSLKSTRNFVSNQSEMLYIYCISSFTAIVLVKPTSKTIKRFIVVKVGL